MSYVSFSTHTHTHTFCTHFFVQIWAKRLLKIMYTRQHTFFDKHLYILYVMPLNCLLFKCTNSNRHTQTQTHTHGHDEEHEEHEQAGKKKRSCKHIILLKWAACCCLWYIFFFFHFISCLLRLSVCPSRCRRPRCIKFRGDAYI